MNEQESKTTMQEIEKMRVDMLATYSILKTAAMALYHLTDETNPAEKAVMISYAVDSAAEICETNYNRLTDIIV